ncbi:MAG TPA: hypothetical protein VGR82_12000 [Methylomirabilota bacterium]|jgi:hypothetical protein|nr:hypothetical protein [Methylomirabilota bacterium]
MSKRKAPDRRIESPGGLDRHTAEALRLAIERMARAEGIPLTVTVKRAEPPPDSA